MIYPLNSENSVDESTACGVLGHVWYLVVSISDLGLITYFELIKSMFLVLDSMR